MREDGNQMDRYRVVVSEVTVRSKVVTVQAEDSSEAVQRAREASRGTNEGWTVIDTLPLEGSVIRIDGGEDDLQLDLFGSISVRDQRVAAS